MKCGGIVKEKCIRIFFKLLAWESKGIDEKMMLQWIYTGMNV
jgi:hypothetical protein